MLVVITLGVFCGLLAFLSKYKKTQWGLKGAFVLIFLFLASRYKYGWDYDFYLSTYLDVIQNDFVDVGYNKPSNYEIGWLYLNWLTQPIGFFGMTAVLAILNCTVYYFLIKKHVNINYQWLAVLLYVFSPELMMIQASTMRQTIAIIIFVVSLNFLYTKDPIRYFLFIGLATLFHNSAVVLLPLYLLCWCNWNFNAVSRVLLVAIFLIMLVCNASLAIYLKSFISMYFERYEGYQEIGKVKTGLGVLYGTGVFILSLFYDRTPDKKTGLVYKIAIINFMFIPLILMIELIARIGFYFAPAMMVGYPIIISNLKAPLSKILLIVALTFFTGWKFYTFNLSNENSEFYETYQTIFTALKWY